MLEVGTKMKSVGIIGAGPAGLVAAKTFLQSGAYSVIVFEAADRAGGMWRSLPGEVGDKCSPDMRTNLSRFTVAFSDLAWSSVDLSNPGPENTSITSPPMFPKAWQVGQYLRTYAQKFGVDRNIKYNSRVTEAKLSDDSSSWDISYVNSVTQERDTSKFDYLIIGSGFFGKPMRTGNTLPAFSSPNYQHSSEFRDIHTFSPGKIAIIGGGISGSEAAAQAAFQISAAKYSPAKLRNIHTETKIYHIVNRPFYCMPRYLPQNPHDPDRQDFNLAPDFLPLDLVLYNLTRRGTEAISAALSTVPPQKTQKVHEFMRSIIGGDQRELGHSELVYQPEHLQYPGYTGISDTYSEFVRSGTIVPVQGWVEDIERCQDSGAFSLSVTPRSPWARVAKEDPPTSSKIIGANGIIDATGFETDLDFLDANIKRRIGYDSSCARVPLLLTRGSIFAKDVPNLAFVGFYEGPYWSVMELQARLIVEAWTHMDGIVFKPRPGILFQEGDAKAMRLAMTQKSLQVPQFWMMDYVGLVEELSRATSTLRIDSPFKGQYGPVFAARYQSKPPDSDAAIVVQEVVDTIDKSHKVAKFVAAAVFRGMQGIWELRRKIDSRKSATPGGTFSGIAHFYPRLPTDAGYAAEYLYSEEGNFKLDTGLSFPASRRYVYRYNDLADKITAWFTDEDGISVGALFNTWQFYPPEDEFHGWMANGHHWCDPDTYKNTCEFRFRGAAIQSFGIVYQVQGPSKDYVHESWYERPQVDYR